MKPWFQPPGAGHCIAGGSYRDLCHWRFFDPARLSGKLFDVMLLWSILLSVIAVALESVESVRVSYGDLLRVIEWGFTIAFTLEYFLRIICVRRPWRYIFSFFGIVDFLAVIPTYLSLFFTGTHYLLVVRALRLLRVFRVLKLVRLLGEARTLLVALKASQAKISVFLGAVLTLVLIIGSVMYLVEGPENGFTNIPTSMYWAIVTLTTVGYGDITPQTPLGQVFSAMVMIMGYAIIAVPTGIVSVELSKVDKISTQACPDCGKGGHEFGASFCKYCGGKLEP